METTLSPHSPNLFMEVESPQTLPTKDLTIWWGLFLTIS